MIMCIFSRPAIVPDCRRVTSTELKDRASLTVENRHAAGLNDRAVGNFASLVNENNDSCGAGLPLHPRIGWIIIGFEQPHDVSNGALTKCVTWLPAMCQTRRRLATHCSITFNSCGIWPKRNRRLTEADPLK
jgi:hypothetical protein